MLLNNSSGNSTGQLTNNAILGITAATCCIVCLLVLIALSVCAKCYSQSTVCGTTIKRLAVGLIVSTMLYELVDTFYLVRYFHPEIKDFCEFQGFLIQYTASVPLLGICSATFSAGCMSGSVLGSAETNHLLQA